MKIVPINAGVSMKTPKHFKIGKPFWSATGKWIVRDIGTRSVIADLEIGTSKKHDGYEEVIFWDYDFGGCAPTLKKAARQFRWSKKIQRRVR